MFTKEELLEFPEYWMETFQQEIYRELLDYMEREGLNQKELAKRWNVSKGYISQILNGRSNFSAKKFIELALKLDRYPSIKFVPKKSESFSSHKEEQGRVIDLKIKANEFKENLTSIYWNSDQEERGNFASSISVKNNQKEVSISVKDQYMNKELRGTLVKSFA